MDAAARTRLEAETRYDPAAVEPAMFSRWQETRAFAVEPIETYHPHPAWAEQDSLQWWHAARNAVPQAIERAGAKPTDVAGIGLDCTACTVLPCRADGAPLRRALLWMDQRSFREAEEISATGDPILRWVSGVVSPEWMLPKALCLTRHEPEVYAQAAVPPGEDRTKHSEEFLQEFSELYSDATNAEHEWYVQFTDKQINSYLDEGFVQQGLAERIGLVQPLHLIPI